jgi:hypothetical protein
MYNSKYDVFFCDRCKCCLDSSRSLLSKEDKIHYCGNCVSTLSRALVEDPLMKYKIHTWGR